jgi:hypothetical protein
MMLLHTVLSHAFFFQLLTFAVFKMNKVIELLLGYAPSFTPKAGRCKTKEYEFVLTDERRINFSHSVPFSLCIIVRRPPLWSSG